MAYRLCRTHFRLPKPKKLICEASRGSSYHYLTICRPLKPTQLLFWHYSHEALYCANRSHFERRCRFIHVSSSFNGKVIPYKLSDIGEGIVEVVIKEWLIKTGDRISQFDPICEVQSDKASVTISSRYDGVVKKLYHDIDETAKVGAPLIDIEVEDGVSEEKKNEQVSEAAPETPIPQVSEEHVHLDEKILITPAVRRLARENNLDLSKIKGTGKAGRILKEDIILYIEKAKDAKVESSTAVEGQRPLPPSTMPPPFPTVEGKDVVQKITGIRKAMVKSMNEAWKIPLFTYCDEVNAVGLVNMKDDLKRMGQARGIKITFMPFLIKATSLALNKYPILNAVTDQNCENITLKASHNIGVSIDTPHGLVVPNIKNVQKLDIFEIARELNRLQEIAAKGRLGLEDLNGGTATLSNIGIIGGTYTSPIILPPQVLIAGIGKIQVLPRFDEKKNVVESHIFKISWVADHRIIDGATVARFSNLWKLYVEYPQLLLSL